MVVVAPVKARWVRQVDMVVKTLSNRMSTIFIHNQKLYKSNKYTTPSTTAVVQHQINSTRMTVSRVLIILLWNCFICYWKNKKWRFEFEWLSASTFRSEWHRNFVFASNQDMDIFYLIFCYNCLCCISPQCSNCDMFDMPFLTILIELMACQCSFLLLNVNTIHTRNDHFWDQTLCYAMFSFTF